MATKRYDRKFFSPLSSIAVFGSRIRDPGWVKIRIWYKHPGSGINIPDPHHWEKDTFDAENRCYTHLAMTSGYLDVLFS
jgi:hypothetical protein